MNKQMIKKNLPGLDALWMATRGTPDVLVAVLDGPVDLNHETLKQANIRSLDHNTTTPVRSFHGTFISSLIFADHQSAVMGIAPNCRGLHKSIYYENSEGQLSNCSQADIAQGIFAALDHQADIINISGGEKLNAGDEIMPILEKALQQCEQKGVLVVAATGNEGDEQLHVPASYPTVLAVGSMNAQGEPSGFSNWTKDSAKHGILATGEDIVGAVPSAQGGCSTLQGTSFSTALVSGVAALLASLQIHHGLKKDLLAVRHALLNSVIPCTATEGINCARVLAGRLNRPGALRIACPTVNTAPVVTALTTQHPLNPNSDFKTRDQILVKITTASHNPPNIKETSMSNETQAPSVPAAQLANASDIAQVVPAAAEPVAVPSAMSTPPAMGAVAPLSATTPSCYQSNQVSPSNANSHFNPAANQGAFPTFENSQLVNAIGQPSYDFGIESNLDTFKAHMKLWYNNLSPELQDELTDSPFDHRSMAAFLLHKDSSGLPNLYMSSQLIWLLNMNATPIYAITPGLVAFSNQIFVIMAQFLGDNVGIDATTYQNVCSGLDQNNIPLEQDKKSQMLLQFKQDLKTKQDAGDDVMRMVLPGYISGQSQLSNRNMIQSVTPVAYGLADWTVEKLVDSMGLEP
jgi:cyanobactin maturation PatA/PatG family protease